MATATRVCIKDVPKTQIMRQRPSSEPLSHEVAKATGLHIECASVNPENKRWQVSFSLPGCDSFQTQYIMRERTSIGAGRLYCAFSDDENCAGGLNDGKDGYIWLEPEH